jgi:hypothetical protein
MATKLKIVKTRGDTSRINFTIKDSSKFIVDISDWTGFTLTVDPSETPTDGTTKVSQVAGQLTTGGLNGRFYFQADDDIPVGSYFYDVQAVDANGDKCTIAKGAYIVEQDITKT